MEKFWGDYRRGMGEMAYWSTKAAICLKRVKIRGKLLWRAYRESSTVIMGDNFFLGGGLNLFIPYMVSICQGIWASNLVNQSEKSRLYSTESADSTSTTDDRLNGFRGLSPKTFVSVCYKYGIELQLTDSPSDGSTPRLPSYIFRSTDSDSALLTVGDFCSLQHTYVHSNHVIVICMFCITKAVHSLRHMSKQFKLQVKDETPVT